MKTSLPCRFATTQGCVAFLILTLAMGAGFPKSARCDLFLTLTEGVGGTVDMTVVGVGTVTGVSDRFLAIGHPSMDSFLPNSAPSRVGTAPVPPLMLGTASANNNFHRDDGGAGNGVESLLGFEFGVGALNGDLDLSDLSGDYNLPGSVFSDFVPGTYTGLTSANGGALGDFSLQGLGTVTVQVVPEPSAFPLGCFLCVTGVCRGWWAGRFAA